MKILTWNAQFEVLPFIASDILTTRKNSELPVVTKHSIYNKSILYSPQYYTSFLANIYRLCDYINFS